MIAKTQTKTKRARHSERIYSKDLLIFVLDNRKPQMLNEFAQQLFQSYDSFCVNSFSRRRFTQEEYYTIIESLKLPPSVWSTRIVGHSLEKRPIRLISAGKGKNAVLMWSQMHGDESTATMAITDILQFISRTLEETRTQELLNRFTIHFLPMLNPDGAERFQRRTANGIDMNRDALALRTPEARILRQLQQELQPEFGFNLHDQELSTIGSSKTLTAIALLAPAFNHAKEDNEVRLMAKHLAAVFADTMSLFIPGAIARYDDSFESRAFGDNMQKWGTSTLLIESGHSFNDPEKWGIRKLNAVGILTSLFSIASGDYRRSDISSYESLPFNGKKVYDLIIRNISIDHHGTLTPADIAISYQVDTHVEETPILIDTGDLHTFVGLKELDGKGKRIPSSVLRIGKVFAWAGMIG